MPHIIAIGDTLLRVWMETARAPENRLRPDDRTGLFDPSIRELVEMVYQWQQPYVVDDSRHRATFGRAATPWNEAVAATVAWGRERFRA